MHKKTDSVCLNVTLKWIHITIVTVEKQWSSAYLECVRSLSYPACKAHVLYYIVICLFLLYSIFPCYLTNGTTFRKKLSDIKRVFFLYNLCLKHFLVYEVRKVLSYMYIGIQVKSPLFVGFKWNLNCQTHFLKNTQISSFKTSVKWEPSSMQMDRQTWGN